LIFELISNFFFSSDATRKRYNSEKNLSKNLEEKDRIEREFVKKREKVKTIVNVLFCFCSIYALSINLNLNSLEDHIQQKHWQN